jgi:hypothetical protein
MATSVSQYVTQRAELLANLALTRRKDVQLVSFADREAAGIDLLARIEEPVLNGQVFPSFGVKILGTSEPLEDEQSANRYLNRHGKHRPRRGFLLCPLVVLLFSMEGDVGYFSWLMEPQVSKDAVPRLSLVSPLRATT